MQPSPQKRKLDRCMGALLGLAVGDALGTTLEFTLPGKFKPIDDMVGGGPFGLLPGAWTDDTSMALCMAESLIASKGFEPADQLIRYCRWADSGHMSSIGYCFDIGGVVRHALEGFRIHGRTDADSTNPNQAGNGSIMRLAPVPIYFHGDADKAVHFSGESSKTTHGATACIEACRYFGGLIWAAVNGVEKKKLLSDCFSPTETLSLKSDILRVAKGSFKERNQPEIRGTGYVVESLEAALWAFYHSTDFRSGALLAVNLGQDADTTGAVYGQIAGAFYGESAIPPKWRAKLAHLDLIERMARQLAQPRN